MWTKFLNIGAFLYLGICPIVIGCFHKIIVRKAQLTIIIVTIVKEQEKFLPNVINNFY